MLVLRRRAPPPSGHVASGAGQGGTRSIQTTCITDAPRARSIPYQRPTPSKPCTSSHVGERAEECGADPIVAAEPGGASTEPLLTCTDVGRTSSNTGNAP